MAINPKKVKALANKRSEVIRVLLDQMEGKVKEAQRGLLSIVLDNFLDGMELDGDKNIKNTLGNKRRLAMFDGVFNKYVNTDGLAVVQTIAQGVGRVVDFNQTYFEAFTEPAQLAPISSNVKTTIGAWLGLNERGNLQANGYLDTLVKDPTVKNNIKNLVLKSVISQGGYQDTKKQLGEFIAGNREKTGALQKYYRNFAYDLYSVADRTAGKVYADKLKFNFAIYEGGLVEASRPFCEEHNGKVFSRDEIALFDITEARPPNYDPFTDLGGYGCRHHLNWVPDAVAFAMRPELRGQTKPKPPEQIAPIDPPKPAPGVPREATPANTPFEDIKPFKIQGDWGKTPAAAKRLKEFGNLGKERDRAQEEANEIYKGITKLNNDYNKLPWNGDLELKQQLTDQISAAWAKLRGAQQVYKDIAAKIQPLNDATRADLLKGKERSPVKAPITSPTFKKDKEFNARFTDALDFYRVAARGLVDERSINVNSGGGNRNYHLGGEVFLSSKTPARVMVHELAHVLEYNNHVLKAAVDFLDRRTAGQPTRKFGKPYKAHEVYKEGGFYDRYVGKIYAGDRYKGRRSTEIISMGLERMYADPLEFYNADPEHFNFIYELLLKNNHVNY